MFLSTFDDRASLVNLVDILRKVTYSDVCQNRSIILFSLLLLLCPLNPPACLPATPQGDSHFGTMWLTKTGKSDDSVLLLWLIIMRYDRWFLCSCLVIKSPRRPSISVINNIIVNNINIITVLFLPWRHWMVVVVQFYLYTPPIVNLIDMQSRVLFIFHNGR